MSAEQEPKEYQFKHHKQITLDGYNGVAKDIMEVNDPIADGFMRVADMRKHIAIIQKPQYRVRDYDQIGNVRVAKFLQMPRLDIWRKNDLVETKKEDDTWLVAVNDQELAQNVSRSGDPKKKFDDRFVEAFQQEITKGIKDCLRREKLLNSGEYNLTFLWSCYHFFAFDLFLVPAIEVVYLLNSLNNTDLGQAVDGTARNAVTFAVLNAGINATNLFYVGYTKLTERLGWRETDLERRMPFRREAHYEDPFIRHSIPEYVMPSVPVDRLMRGLRYLKHHTGELIYKS